MAACAVLIQYFKSPVGLGLTRARQSQ